MARLTFVAVTLKTGHGPVAIGVSGGGVLTRCKIARQAGAVLSGTSRFLGTPFLIGAKELRAG